ncbi:tetratricopeptide repeat protein [Flavobacterium sp. Sd200]|uniref:tetratricopeptide repeat protein n=1 Tax=Flavobacterium sp. Sd200 TaxID=2692211 RepID=UPI00136A668F|nr:tetratricopeptide repeat protein [Flavobacterium sp. Sd200]MXN90699.1 tetratricopeptide repeat protein [Flavobacterium sp. Sd200]
MHFFDNLYKKIIVTCLLLIGTTFYAQQVTVKQCDSIIRQGVLKTEEKKYLRALELLTEAQAIASKNKWGHQMYGSTVNLGNCYVAMMDYGEGLKYYLEAYNIAIKFKYKNLEIGAINNIAIFYSREGEFKKAYDYFKRAYDISKEQKDSTNIGIYTLNLGMILGEMKKYKEAHAYFKEALKYANNNPRLVLGVNAGLAETEMDMGYTQKAKNFSLSLLDQIPDKVGNDAAISLQLNVAKGFLLEKNYPQAEKYALMGLKNSAELSRKQKIYTFLSKIYAQNKDFDKALQYKDSVFAVQQELNNIKNGRVYENNRVKFEIQDYKNQIAIKNATIAKDRKVYFAVVICITLILLLIIFIFRTISMRHKQKKLIAENSQQVMALRLAKQESEALQQEKLFQQKQHEIILEKELLKNEIEHKNRKLSSQALYTSGKYQMIEDVVKLLNDIPEIAQLPVVKKHIRFLRNSLNSDNEWEGFLTHFEEVNHGFLTRLKAAHPDLNANDIRFICYVYMNLNAKEIAAMLNISLDAGRKRKERISQKLGLKDSSMLFSYLYEI